MLLCSLFFSCGYFENDGILSEEGLVGRFEITQDRSDLDKNFQLVFKNSETSFVGISQSCKQIIYDSLNKKIFVKEETSKNYFTFKKIVINDLKTNDILKAYDRKNIKEKDFNLILNNCKNCIIKNY